MAPGSARSTPGYPPTPVLGACPGGDVPQLPPQWHAIALLTPFEMGDMMVAEVLCDSAAGNMWIKLMGVSGGSSLMFIMTPEGVYFRLTGNEWIGPVDLGWVVPGQDWLAGRGCSCVGTQRILTQECAWWVGLSPCTNGCEQGGCPPVDVGNWLWFRTDNGMPWRFMFINADNPYALPVLGDCAFVHFPLFEPTDAAAVSAHVDAARASAKPSTLAAAEVRDLSGMLKRAPVIDPAEHRAELQSLIPGLTPLQGTCSQLPSWPDTMYVNALTVPTAGSSVLVTEIFYDATIDRMLTRLWEPGDTRDDLILTPGQTYDVSYQGGVEKGCAKADPVGPPYQNWPVHDQCQCRAAIAHNPDFAPDDTIIIFNCPSDPPRNFWIWYTAEGRPVMFSEVPQYCDVGLILIDYYEFVPNAQIDPDMFTLPTDCGQTHAAAAEPRVRRRLQPLMRRIR